MRALILATGDHLEQHPLCLHSPSPLLKVIDRPIIELIIEYLITRGIKEFSLFLHHHPELIEEELAHGERWGVTIQYHLVRNPDRPFEAISPTLDSLDDSHLLLGQGDLLPSLNIDQITEERPKHPHLFYSKGNRWSGWGIFPKNSLKVPKHLLLKNLPQTFKHKSCSSSRIFLNTQSLQGLHETNIRLIQSKTLGSLFPTTTINVDKGKWISKSASIHPTAKVISPVFVGKECQIDENCTVGPNTILEEGSIISSSSVLKNSLLMRNSYIGEELDFQNCLVNKNYIYNLTLNTHLTVPDDFIVSEASHPSIQHTLLKFVSRFGALLLLMLLSPLIIPLLYLKKIETKEMVKLPAEIDPLLWTTFDWLTFEKDPEKPLSPTQKLIQHIPSLWNIFRGDLGFVGIAPKSKEELQSLEKDWQLPLLKSKTGLITLLSTREEGYESLEEKKIDEIYYTTYFSPLFDLKIALKALLNQGKGG